MSAIDDLRGISDISSGVAIDLTLPRFRKILAEIDALEKVAKAAAHLQDMDQQCDPGYEKFVGPAMLKLFDALDELAEARK